MKYRRSVIALALLCAMLLTVARAEGTIRLDGIGLRYTPAEGEVCLTRDDMDAQALAALGTDAETLLASMERDGSYLIGLQPDGRQVFLEVADKPAGIACDNACDMTGEDKSLFLTTLARLGGYGGAFWRQDGYALFSSGVETQGSGVLSYADLSLSTLYLGRVYTFRMDLIGREAGQADADLLLSAAGRTLRLGAAAQGGANETAVNAPLALPSTAVESADAVPTYRSSDCPLSLVPVAAVVGVTSFPLTGVTAPGAYVRYSVNGRAASRVKADDTGAFGVTVTNLVGDAENAVEVTAYKDDLKTVVDFIVTVDWQNAPLTLETPGVVEADGVTLAGLVLPGSTVELIKGRGSNTVTVADDGSFSVRLSLRAVGENGFILRVRADGYHRNDYDFTVTRAESAAETAQRLSKEAKSTDYGKLAADPAAYRGRVLHVSGVASGLEYANGSPRFTLTDGEENRYVVLVADLLDVPEGATVDLYGTATGEADAESGRPMLELGLLLP